MEQLVTKLSTAKPIQRLGKKKIGNVWVCSQGLKKIQEVQQMFSVKRHWKPQELHLLFFFFFNISLFVRWFFPLK